ncbi:MAG: hypothetical protein HYZ75_15590 [Elusimicrobia bacterium]|nr:hypothetical protein [Elusimicrobiota bacterium]
MKLRTQWAFVSILLPAYALAAAAALWVQARSHAELEASFQRDLGALAALPRLRDSLRRLEQTTERYLQSGDRRLLKARRETLADLRRLEAGVGRIAEGPEERALVDRLGREVAAVLSEQERWIERRAQGRLPRAQAVRLSSRDDAVAEVTAVLLKLKDADRERLDARRVSMERSGRRTLWLLLSAGLAGGLLAAGYLGRALVGPVARLQDYARAWKLGEPWSLETAQASPEVSDLYARLSEMAGRLGVQFEKEQELGKMKTQLVAMVSHEFNNTLSILGGILLLLKGDEPAPLPARRAQFYTIMEGHVRSLAVTSRTLLELGRLEAGRLTVRPRRMDLSVLAQECAQRLEILWARKALRVSVEAPEPVWVNADPDALALVTTNLLSNAVKYTPEGGRVTVGVRAAEGRVEFFVADDGIGIAEEDRAKILSGYYRAEEGKKAAKGFGVGLALAQVLLQAHAAELSVESSPGKGARFAFSLPPA